MSSFDMGVNSTYIAGIQINYEMRFRIYYPKEEKIVYSKLLKDTLYWNDSDASVRELFNRMTSIKKALNEAGFDAALQLADKIGTNWKDENRYYFSKGNPELKQAAKFVETGDWEQAMAIWKNIAENNSNTDIIKSKAQYNIALGYEILGDIDQAISWALSSYNTRYQTITYRYLEILRKRKNELKNQEK